MHALYIKVEASLLSEYLQQVKSLACGFHEIFAKLVAIVMFDFEIFCVFCLCSMFLLLHA